MYFFDKGTNLGFKKHSVPMQPTMNMDTSSKILNSQVILKSKEIEEVILNNYHSTEKNGPNGQWHHTVQWWQKKFLFP